MKKILIRSVFVFSFIGLLIFLAFKLSPWPSALVIRYIFNREAVNTNDALLKHVPAGVGEKLNLQYDNSDPDSKLDLYFPSDINVSKTQLPLVVWIHGGGLISGDKGQVGNYCKILASKGFIVASIDYSIAPESKYPKPVQQTMNALAYLMAYAGNLHINKDKIFIAGDSGGSHIASQTANIIYNSYYAGLVKIVPVINPTQLKGLLLYCGIYDLTNIDLTGKFGGFFRTVLWA